MSKITRLSGSATEPLKLDLKDKKIMAILVDDARISLTQLAKKVGLKRETVDYRIKKLLEQKYITGFVPMINFSLLGYSHFEIFILFTEQGEQHKEKVIQELANLPYTKSIVEYNDRWDIKLTLLARGLDAFEKFYEEIQEKFHQYILEKEVVVSLKQYVELSISDLFLSETKQHNVAKTQVAAIELDKKDLIILQQLSENCRQSTYQLADKVGLSPDGVGLRIKKMVEKKIILKFITLFDNSKSPLYWYTFAAQLNNFSPDIETKISQLFKNHSRVMSARKTLGNWDLLFSIVADSHKEIHAATRAIKMSLSNSLKNYQVWLAYKEPYFTSFPKIIAL